ncbi:MAG: Transcription elongation factor Spt4 [Candidatus Woesearchaeota archaeon]|nr:Transcription elongation factor Spt4 [Candidatus Woesearchaeota archaeon]
MKKKVCKSCKIFVEGKTCPLCKKDQFSTNWKGRVYVLDVKKSVVAEKIGAEVKGEYAIKI